MKNALVVGGLFLTTIASTSLLIERDAQACGGCFNPPETPTVVTDHRMVLTVSKDQSTLYDQIKYSGAPASFAWVLPISGEVTIGLSADVVFSGLDRMTQTQLLQPPRNCPSAPDNCSNRVGASAGSSSGSGGNSKAEDPGVTVIKREVVGPYETVQLAATNPNALREWLSTNGFAVPPDVAPVVDKYVLEKFNFLALKLQPGKDTQDMRPVRVSTKGASVALPLRMVAAGTGPTVGISLWIVGEGRYEPQNFPSFIIATDEIAWDWNSSKSNYIELRAQKTAAGNGKIWEIESSIDLPRQTLESIVQQGTYDGSSPFPTTDEERAEQDYLPVKDGQGNITKTALAVRNEDLETLFHGIANTPRVTRIRADLAHASLDSDLLMTASKDQAQLPNTRQIVKELNQPLCPVFEGCETVGTAPRDEAIARSKASTGGETFSCGASRRSPRTWAGVAFAALAIVELVRRRYRRS